MAERALALETRAARQIKLDDLRARGQRRRERGAARAVDCGQRLAERGGDVHQPGVVADHQRRARHEIDRLGQRAFAAQVDARIAAGVRNLVTNRGILGRSCEPHVVTGGGEPLREISEICGRPALGGAVLGARAQHCDWPLRVEVELGKCGGALGRIDLQSCCGERALDRVAGCFGEQREALGHQWQRLLVQSARVVEQTPARFTDEARAPRNAGEKRDQRRFKRIGQHDRLIVVLRRDAACKRVTAFQREFAVSEWAVDRGVYFRHARE